MSPFTFIIIAYNDMKERLANENPKCIDIIKHFLSDSNLAHFTENIVQIKQNYQAVLNRCK